MAPQLRRDISTRLASCAVRPVSDPFRHPMSRYR